MLFEWDEKKRAANRVKHGVDFEAARLIFDGATITGADTRHDYGEPRFGSYGMANGVLLFVVYTERGNSRRIISARKAGTDEKKFYDARIAKEK